MQNESAFKDMAKLMLSNCPAHVIGVVCKALRESKDPAAMQSDQVKQETATRSLARTDDYNRAVRRAGIVGDMREDTFPKYQPIHDLQKKAFSSAREFAKSWPDVGKRGLMLYGQKGTGKSHLLRAIGLGIMKLNSPCPDVRYFYAPEIERALKREAKNKQTYDGTGFMVGDIESELTNCDLLLIDDVSKLDPSLNAGWMLNLIGCIIDKAERTGSPIICGTSNHSTEELGDRLGYPFVSRLQALMHWQNVQGPDHRENEETPYWAI